MNKALNILGSWLCMAAFALLLCGALYITEYFFGIVGDFFPFMVGVSFGKLYGYCFFIEFMLYTIAERVKFYSTFYDE